MLEPGKILGERYEILEKIGAGGMSIVYLAKCNKLQRHVAIKVLREEFAQDEEFVKKFRAEALSAASLSHPNVVGIYDVGIEEELKYIVMEYVEGETLKDYLRKHGPFTSEQTLEFGIQIVSAIRHAHKRQIVHRDIKPQNILMTHEHVLKVADFGIARAVDSSTIVATGNAIGSVHYFSPEQAKGKYVNETSDLYSCGIVLFELVTNQLPFQADSHVSIALKHINDQLPLPSSIVQDVSKGLEQLILKATQKNQEDRYQNADEMLEDMKMLLINPNASIQVEDNTEDYTILLTPDETQYLRNNEQALSSVENYFEEEEEEDGNGNVSPLYKFLVGFGAVCITVLIFIGAILLWFFWKPADKGPVPVAVPEIIGMTINQATNILKSAGLTIKQVDEVINEEMSNGEIAKQLPSAKTIVEPGTEIAVTVVNNPTVVQVDVIDVIGITADAAKDKLGKLGLKVEVRHDYSDDIEVGKVVEQQPEPGTTVEAGKTVKLVVSSGPKVVKVNVPNLYNLTQDEVKISLRNEGLEVGKITEKSHATIEAGRVFEQGIGATTEVEKGTPIDITISTGPEEVAEPEEELEDETEGDNTVTPENPDGGSGSEGNTEETLPPDEGSTGEESGTVTKTHIISPLDNNNKEEYHILVMLESNEGSKPIFDNMVKAENLPLTIEVSGKGKGTLITYFNSQEEYRDEINFDEVAQ